MTDFYCNQKFNWVQVSMFDGRVQSCCQAEEDSPSIKEIKSHPVGFFNYPQIVKDRTSMINGEKISGCHRCWTAEDNGLTSRRLNHKNKEVLCDTDDSRPETLNLVISNTCAMTCVYCCKKFSHSWRADLVANGNYNYFNDQRYTATARDKVLYKLSQQQLEHTEFYQVILEQVQNTADSVKKIIISGGEPFLSNNLLDLLDKISNDSIEIVIWTGLGVSTARLSKIIKHLIKFKNLTVRVSGENIGRSYEFVRYGNSFANFEKNINLLTQNNITVGYACSISSISTFDFLNFVSQYGNPLVQNLYVTTVDEPGFLSPNVLDNRSKQDFLNRLVEYKNYFDTTALEKAVSLPCSEHDRINSRDFLVEFAQRRNLSLEIFPESFVSWLTK
jgi:organic radical activating enzyme